VEHAGFGVLVQQPTLKLVITFRESSLGAAFAGLGLGDQTIPSRLEFRLGLAASLLKAGFDQDVVEDTRDADAERLLHVAGVKDDLEIGPESFQVVGIHLRGGLVFEQEMLVADPDDTVDAAGQHETSGRRAGGGVYDASLKGLLEDDDFEFFDSITGGVAHHHRGGHVPVPFLLFISSPVGVSPVDEVEDGSQFPAAVPDLQALVDHRAEGQIAVPFQGNQFMDVAPLARLAAVTEQVPHRIGGCCPRFHHAAPVVLSSGPTDGTPPTRSTLKASSPNSRVRKPVKIRAMARPTSVAASTTQERFWVSNRKDASKRTSERP